MRTLNFEYNMSTRFSTCVEGHKFALRCEPKDTERQRVINSRIEISGDIPVYHAEDSFGNILAYGELIEPHTLFEVSVTGSVETGINIYEQLEDDEADMFKYPSRYTAAGEEILRWYEDNSKKELDAYSKALSIMKSLKEYITYSKGATDPKTTAEEAMSIKKGVCQDYTHIMLAMLRSEHIPCRYVVGMMEGEGESHAWAEVLCRGYWYGFDPTNGRLVDDRYIKISSGRDSGDCAVIRAVFSGCASEMQNVSVSVQ